MFFDNTLGIQQSWLIGYADVISTSSKTPNFMPLKIESLPIRNICAYVTWILAIQTARKRLSTIPILSKNLTFNTPFGAESSSTWNIQLLPRSSNVSLAPIHLLRKHVGRGETSLGGVLFRCRCSCIHI